VRGAVTWKSIVGTNVASDALSNLASPGVRGGALIVVGEDYGDGSSVVQERTHAFAMKSSLCLLDPRPELPQIVRMVEHAFALSEASATPAILQLRIRACHLQGSFACKDNVAPAVSGRHPLQAHAPFDGNTMSHPPYTFEHERLKVEERVPAARRYIAEHRLNETFGGDVRDVGIVVQGGLYNNLSAALATAGFVDGAGASRIPLLVLNVTYPLVPDELVAFCAGKRAVLVLEEGHPEFIEFELAATLTRAEIPCAVRGWCAGSRASRRSSRHPYRRCVRPHGATASTRCASRRAHCWRRPCRHARPDSASAARSARCSALSSSRSASWGRGTSQPTSAAIRSRCSSRS